MRFAIFALSIIGLCNFLARASAETLAGTSQKRYVLLVATSASLPKFGNRVSNPSLPAWPALSVTPGLNPACIAM